MKISPRTLPGILHASNKGSCDLGWQEMFAYGCQNIVVVVATSSLQVIQALDQHTSPVEIVKWSRENYHHDMANPYCLTLASAESNGKVFIWDVAQAIVRTELFDSAKSVVAMEWLTTQDASHDLLAVLHASSNFILWNTATGTKLWKKTYYDMLLGFSFDPFDFNCMAFLGQDSIIFIEDFSVSTIPSNGKKYYISTPSSHSHSNSDNSIMNGSAIEKFTNNDKKSKSGITKRMTNILVRESNKKYDDDSNALNECLQLVYHKACKHHLILLYSREILILDLSINQTVGIIPAEKSGSLFLQVIPLLQRDVMMCLHENGSITVRVRRRISQAQLTQSTDSVGTYSNSEDSPTHSFYDVSYDLRSQSDPLRITKSSRVYGIAVDPIGEMKSILIMSDGRLLVWELKTVDYDKSNMSGSVSAISPLYTPGLLSSNYFDIIKLSSTSLPLICEDPLPKLAISDLIGKTQSFVSESQASLASPSLISPCVTDGFSTKHSVLLKMVLTGFMNGVAPPPLVLRMCPPLTTKNWNSYVPLLAVGTSLGCIQLYNLSNGDLWREYSIHSSGVKGIEWISLESFLSYSVSYQGNNGLVKNDLMLTSILTGKSKMFRQNKDEESPIEMVRVSYLKQYIAILFKDKPFELWDLRLGILLRQMPKNFPHVTTLEWSPSHNLKSLRKKINVENEYSPVTQEISSSLSSIGLNSGTSIDAMIKSDEKYKRVISVKEHFVFTDIEGLLYHFMIEGNNVKDGSKIPPDGGMGSITCIAWKGETIVLGDVDGNINIWDLKARISRAIPTHRGCIKKIKFAPGRGQMKLLVLYSNEGVDVWDTKDSEVVSNLKVPKDIVKIHDAEWAGSDRPVLACSDGCIRVFNIKLTNACSPIDDNFISSPIFCPRILSPKASLYIKSYLQHQRWQTQFSLTVEETEDNADICSLVNDHLKSIPSKISSYISHCPYGTAQRCFYTARLFGDESELLFWTIALHYLRNKKSSLKKKKGLKYVNECNDIFIPKSQECNSIETSFELSDHHDDDWNFVKDFPLETCYDILCDNSTYQKYQLDRVSLHDSKRSSYEQTKKCAENLLLLGQTDRAVKLYLETDSNNDNYYSDSLQACLVASIRSSGASQSTIKLVATNLIASGKLSEGIQLLCLIDKGLDACRYLQTYGAWTQAAWLAKCTLKDDEYLEVMKRWLDHLCSPQIDQKGKAVLVALSLEQFSKAIEILYSLRQFDRATLFIEACQEFEVIENTNENKDLMETVFLEYARYLLSLSLIPASKYYCKLAGKKGELFLNDLESLPQK